MYKNIEKFFNVVNRCVQRKEKKITMSVEESVNIQTEIAKLLLELKRNNNSNDIKIDGGKF